ncbi:MAG: hypothetical protein KDD06_19485 [Phaeodactylibacter sp.]|nr:hypothetical protein [Phaeodactylibacter sp.]MCB9266931.1 hypothetical protein [Lewinellaceae bacterium]MCB9285723.1 hypothetical protein [Lewinellaceae bacterium]
MKFLVRVVSIIILTSLITGCETTEIRKAMVHFDRAFIPVLAYTYEGDIHQAKRSVFYLEFQWQKVKKQYQGYLPDEKERLNRVDNWLGDAYFAIDANKPLTAANQLEHVKYEFMELRRKYGVDYYLDGLYEFQDAIALLAEAAEDEMMCLMEWGEYEHLLYQAMDDWQAIRAKKLDAELFEFDEARLRQLVAKQDAMQAVLDQYAETFSCANRKQLAIASQSLQPVFFDVLILFGNFEASQTYFAQK